MRFARIGQLKVQVFSHVSDIRHDTGKTANQSELDLPVIAVGEAARILELTEANTDVVAVDEAQLFDWALAEVAEKLVLRGVRVIIAGLDLDFRGEPFGVIPLLMAQADYLTKFNALCVICSDPASRTQWLIDGRAADYNETQFVVGDSETYEARCRLHHEVPGKPRVGIVPRQVGVDVE